MNPTPNIDQYSNMPEDELFFFVPYNKEETEQTAFSDYSYWKSVWRCFCKKKSAVIMMVLFIGIVIFSYIALKIGNYDYNELVSDTSKAFISPNKTYWFGTDNLGRDYWCQVWYACHTSIRLALIVAVGETIIGTVAGLIWGYMRRLDSVFNAIFNIIDNIPAIIYLTLVAMLLGQSFTIICLAVITVDWVYLAKKIRNLVMMYRDRDYNQVSRCLGTPIRRILTKNIFPYLISILMLSLALSIPATIALETTLSYLGLGLGIDTPSLGILLRNARVYFLYYPYLLICPAVVVSIITISFYLAGNALADASDPKNHV